MIYSRIEWLTFIEDWSQPDTMRNMRKNTNYYLYTSWLDHILMLIDFFMC